MLPSTPSSFVTIDHALQASNGTGVLNKEHRPFAMANRLVEDIDDLRCRSSAQPMARVRAWRHSALALCNFRPLRSRVRGLRYTLGLLQ